jgi:hypothetical protein
MPSSQMYSRTMTALAAVAQATESQVCAVQHCHQDLSSNFTINSIKCTGHNLSYEAIDSLAIAIDITRGRASIHELGGERIKNQFAISIRQDKHLCSGRNFSETSVMAGLRKEYPS